MLEFGMRIRDALGSTLLLTPDIHTIVSSGRVSMPVGLNGDGTYGLNIDLPGTGSYAAEDIGVVIAPFVVSYIAHITDLVYNGAHGITWFASGDVTLYTRNESTGVMSVWVPNLSTPAAYDPILSVYPACFWDEGAAGAFTAVRLFAAVCYEVYDTSASAFIKAYAISTAGVSSINYAVYARRYKEV